MARVTGPGSPISMSSTARRGVTSAAGRLRYYAERFDNVEVDSTYYALPHPETAARWVERTPPAFTFNVKASGEMTGHRPGPGCGRRCDPDQGWPPVR